VTSGTVGFAVTSLVIRINLKTIFDEMLSDMGVPVLVLAQSVDD
jgi:hypothetical protein